ncbi:MAG: SPFH domain-containing protein [Armatimonadetes bacterium]|nr:SPFH domain-containing protein [Armatimonadota bacterium]
MLGFHYVKAPPTTYLMQFVDGRPRREGAGLSFFYFGPTSTLVAVPLESTDMPFIFQETTSDFQTVTVQGQLTYRVREPKLLAASLDFTADAQLVCVNDGRDLLMQRLIHYTQVATRASVSRMDLREALAAADVISSEVISALREHPATTALGVEIMALAIVSQKPTPEMSRALEAEAREALQRKADEAIYDRRNAAVEQERRIRESELNTELAVEAKQRQIREAKMAAEIAVEEQRTVLLEQRLENDRQEADTRAYALESVLKQVRDVDWKTLMAVSGGANDSRANIAVAFRELAENASKIGELNVTPDLLKSLLGKSA